MFVSDNASGNSRRSEPNKFGDNPGSKGVPVQRTAQYAWIVVETDFMEGEQSGKANKDKTLRHGLESSPGHRVIVLSEPSGFGPC